MQYEPELNLPPVGSPDTINVISNSYDQVFGFQTKASTNISIPPANSNAILLTPSQSSSSTIVLNNPWPMASFESRSSESYYKSSQQQYYTGQKWYFAIRVKLNAEYDANKLIQEELFIIANLKNNRNIGSERIRFKQISSFVRADLKNVIPMHSGTGVNYCQYTAMENTYTIIPKAIGTIIVPYIDKFSIKRGNLIPNQFITVYGYFETFPGGLNCNSNSELALEKKPGFNNITFQVNYCNKSSLEIDYVRIESEQAHYLYQGKFDQYAAGIAPSNVPTIKPVADPVFYSDGANKDVSYKVDDIVTSINENLIGNSSNLSAGITHQNPRQFNLFRIFAQEWESPNPVFWGQLRYLNKITGNACVTRDEANLCSHFYKYTGAMNKYMMLKLAVNEHYTPAPWLKMGNWHPNYQYTGGYKYGRQGNAIDVIDYNNNDKITQKYLDLYTSHYETFLVGDIYYNKSPLYAFVNNILFRNTNDIKNNVSNLATYTKMLNESNSVQSGFEEMILPRFYFPENNSFLFSDNSWIMNYLMGASYQMESGITSVQGVRPKTAEETRLLINFCKILGAKGFVFDRENSSKDGVSIKYQGTAWPNFDDPLNPKECYFGIGWGDNPYWCPILTPFNTRFYDLADESVGGDWVTQSTTTTPSAGDVIGLSLNNYLPWGNSYFQSICKPYNSYTGPTKLYVGMKSTRMEIKKQFNYLQSNETTLLNLRLVAWYAKSFVPWTINSPNTVLPSNQISYYIDPTQIKTRPFRRDKDPDFPLTPNAPYYEQHVNIDSGFYDVTILRDVSNTVTSNHWIFYVGVLNRRTDPLIPILYTGTYDTLFVSGADCDSYGNSTNNTLGQTPEWWKRADTAARFGAREISVPLNTPPNSTITVKELGKLTKKYYNNILRETYKPGEAKIFKVEITLPGKKEGETEAQENTNNNFILFPNPANEYIDIVSNFATTDESKVEYEVYSAMGIKVGAFEAQNSSSQRYDTSSLPSGVYIMKALTNGQPVLTKSFVVQR